MCVACYQVLHLDKNSLGAAGAHYLASVLEKPSCVLQELHLFCNVSGGFGGWPLVAASGGWPAEWLASGGWLWWLALVAGLWWLASGGWPLVAGLWWLASRGKAGVARQVSTGSFSPVY